jgi:hypothetical protein
MGHSLQGLGMDFLLEMAKVSGRPLNWNAVIYDPSNPENWKRLLEWNEKAFREALIFPVNICVPIEFEFTMATIGLFDQLPAWNEATVGSLEERKAKLGDPARRPALKADMERPPTVMPGVRGREDGEAGQISMFKWEATFIDEVHLPKNQQHPRADEHVADLRTNPHRWIRPMRAPAPDALIWHRRDALGLPSGVSEHIVNGGDHVGDAQNVSSAQRFVGEIIWSIAVGF